MSPPTGGRGGGGRGGRAAVAGVVSKLDGEGGVVPLVVVSIPATVTTYTVPGIKPVTRQSPVGQVSVTGLPPPAGVAVIVYGPETPVPG